MKSEIINKKLKYFTSTVITLACVMFMYITVLAADVSVSIDSKTVVKGENVTINVSFSSSVTIGGYDAYIQYDASKLEFTGGTVSGGGVVSGGNGRIRIYDDSTPSASVNASLNFVAKELGSHSVYITADSSFYDNNVDDMNLVVASTGVVNVTSAPEVIASSDSSLKELNVFAVKEDGSSTQVWYWPNFSGATTNYSLNVDNNVTKLMITAKANHGSASVSVGDTNLNVGNNNINIVVTAEDGSQSTYTIVTNRSNEEVTTTADEDETTIDDTNRDKTVSIGGRIYDIVDISEEMETPEGYEITDYEYKGNTVKALKGLGTNLVVFGLSSKDDEIEYYIFDTTENVFYKFKMFNLKASQFVFMDMPENVDEIKIPSAFKLMSITVNGNSIDAYGVAQGDNYIVYAMDCNGKKGFYYLNIKNNTLVEYFVISDEEEETTIYSKEQQENNSKEIDELKQEKKIILIISIVVILALISVILIMLLSKKPSSEGDDEDDEDDDEEYELDEIEITAKEAVNEEALKEERERELYETDADVEPEIEEVEEETVMEQTLEEKLKEMADDSISTEETLEIESETQAVEEIEPSTQTVEEIEPSTQTVEEIEPSIQAVEEIEPSTQAVEEVQQTTQAVEVAKKATEDLEEISETVENTEEKNANGNKVDIDKILEDESTSIKADDLDMILDDLLSDIHN